MSYADFLEFFQQFDKGTRVYAQIFAIVFATAFVSYLSRKILLKLDKKFSQTKNIWDDALLFAIRKPLRLFIWVYGLALASSIAFKSLEIEILEVVTKVRELSFIVFLFWSVLRLIRRVEENYNKSRKLKKLDKTTLGAITKLLRVSVIITTFLVVLESLGFSISGVLAFGGLGGLAVGLAAKDMLANFFGAFIIYLDKPFRVGDWIRSPDREIEGTVEDIGWRLTVIRTFDKRPIYVPNSIFSNIIVENPSRMSNRRIYEHYGIRYDDIDNVKKIVSDIKDMLKNHKDIDVNQTLMVNLDNFADSSVEFFVYTFTKTTIWTEYQQVREDVMMKISDIISANNSEFAFPTRTLHVTDSVLQLEKAHGKESTT